MSTGPCGRLVLTHIPRGGGFNFLVQCAWHILILQYCFIIQKWEILLVVVCKVMDIVISIDVCGAWPARLQRCDIWSVWDVMKIYGHIKALWLTDNDGSTILRFPFGGWVIHVTASIIMVRMSCHAVESDCSLMARVCVCASSLLELGTR